MGGGGMHAPEVLDGEAFLGRGQGWGWGGERGPGLGMEAHTPVVRVGARPVEPARGGHGQRSLSGARTALGHLCSQMRERS